MKEQFAPRMEILIADLTDEIDYWRDKYESMKKRHDDLQLEYSSHVNQQIKHGEETIGLLFKVLLNSKQKEDGLLIKQPLEI